MKLIALLLCCAFGTLMSGCAPVVVGAGVAAGTAATEERGVTGSINDTSIRTTIHAKVMGYSPNLFSKLQFKVREGRVLIIGTVDDQQHKDHVLKIVWGVGGVKEIIDEMTLAADHDPDAPVSFDSAITMKIKFNMLREKGLASRNYSVETLRGVVYLMGVAKSQDELDRVLAMIQSVDGVKRTVNCVRVKGVEARITHTPEKAQPIIHKNEDTTKESTHEPKKNFNDTQDNDDNDWNDDDIEGLLPPSNTTPKVQPLPH